MILKLLIFVVTFFVVKAQTSTKNYGICESPNKKLGYCVEIKDCPKIKETIQMRDSILKPELITEKKFITNSQCGKLNDTKYLVCCEDSIFGKPNTPTASNLTSRIHTNLLPTEGECIVKLGEKIVGGTKTSLGEFPWTAILLYSHQNNNSEASGFCGGSLISNRYVLTAAHCAKSHGLINNKIYLSGVRLGEWNKNEEIDCDSNGVCADPPQNIIIEKIIIHENYNDTIKAKHNDIALLKLSRTVKYSNYIKPICLPLTEAVQNHNLTGIALEVTGWGITSWESITSSPIKLKASLKIVPLHTCNGIHKTNPPLVDTQMCAGGEKGMDSCKGDSGGPLIGTYMSKYGLPFYYLVGIVSVGIEKCGTEGRPGVYTRVASFVPWILTNIEK